MRIIQNNYKLSNKIYNSTSITTQYANYVINFKDKQNNNKQENGSIVKSLIFLIGVTINAIIYYLKQILKVIRTFDGNKVKFEFIK